MLESVKIVAFSILCAVVYGILHDQVTAHVCVEYFTVAHPAVFPTSEPFWLAIGWGVIATWWVGLILGNLLALSARLGSYPKINLTELRRAIVCLMVASGTCAMIAGAIGWSLTEANVPGTIGSWEERIKPERHARFAFAAWAHSISYLVGAIGGIAIAIWTVVKRRSMAQAASASSTYSG